MHVELVPVAKGIASYVPGLYTLRSRHRHAGQVDAAYSYLSWLQHLILLNEHQTVPVPQVVAELGPGGSLGVGLAALLCGADTYYALDLFKYTEIDINLALLRRIAELFRNRTPVQLPDREAPTFPDQLLPDLDATLAQDRLVDIGRAITEGRSGSITIEYVVPWDDASVISRNAVDLIVSTSVLEHVDDLGGTYAAFAQWLRPGGFMSHGIDFRSHRLAKVWNGHWRYPDWAWRLIVGRRPYTINRQPCAEHLAMMRKHGFDVTRVRRYEEQGITRGQLARRWRGISDDDLVCAGAIVQAQLPR